MRVGDGATTRAGAFEKAQQAEERPFLGDLTAYAYLDRMAPLVTGEPLQPTDRGWAILDCGERWDDRPSFALGGSRVGRWRWDPETQTVRRAASAP